ncbi:hypothetical protein NIE88_09785 [Sporolactobacillus shoreicorticis]|uniref:MAE-28990/MAE-18760-like HEPN domain-containing protein n=1 Tax=Sporolactobacillus shoreicorticis TaxID=1923877 RepID=A0ABW5S9K8_9BACL|nr:hypothetical protein [Sporolactobacillus shoreicorticis]MCO7126066.1 hypothetical protein [Sporolactobacillus shoreicorticis]
MPTRLPSHNVPLLLIADVLCYINNNASSNIEDLRRFTSKSEAYIRSCLAVCKMLNIIDDNDDANPIVNELGKTPNEELKLNVMRRFIQEYEPFIAFIQYHLNDSTLEESARKVYVLYKFEGKDHIFLKDLFISWGTATSIFAINGNSIDLEEKIKTYLSGTNTLNINLDDDMAIRLYIGNTLSTDIFSTLSSAEIEELVASYKKYKTDPRGAIECAGRAFEDFLRRTFRDVDVSRKNGIGQVINALYNYKNASGVLDNKIHNKQASIGSAIGDIRNMAGHGLEARTFERWNLTSHSAQLYIELVLSTVRSIYIYIQDSSLAF